MITMSGQVPGTGAVGGCLGQVSWIGVRLEFHQMVKFQTDSCHECNDMITIDVSELIPHLSTNFASRHLTSGFGMG